MTFNFRYKIWPVSAGYGRLWEKVSKKLRFVLVQQVKAATYKRDKIFFLPVQDQFINLQKTNDLLGF
jgi:hypothetical protein